MNHNKATGEERKKINGIFRLVRCFNRFLSFVLFEFGFGFFMEINLSIRWE